METALLLQGTELMLVGMGTVFAFLTMLIGATMLMSRAVLYFDTDVEDGPSDEEIAAVTAAVERHRRSR